MKKKFYAVFDTETVGLSPKLVYDLALVICDKQGKIYAQKSWLVREVMTNAKLMMGAFYANRVFSHYIPAMDAQTLRLFDFATVRGEFNEMVKTFGASTVAAYNIGFDRSAIRETCNHCQHSGNFLESKMDFADIWLAACTTILDRKTYRDFAHANNLVSDAGNIRTSAEAAYRFITNNPGFIETHTALEDSIIEAEILAQIFKTKKAFPVNQLVAMPWRIPQRSK